MDAQDVPGPSESAEIPSIPIFPATRLERRPQSPLREFLKSKLDDATSVEGTDRVEISARGRDYHSTQVLFERIARSFNDAARSTGISSALDLTRLDGKLLDSPDSSPDVTAGFVLEELQRVASASFARGEAVKTRAFESFREEARTAATTALDAAKSRLQAAGQLDDATRSRLDATAERIVKGIAELKPF